MGVLKNVGGGWRLFWVLQVIGLSFGLAVLVVKLSGSADTVDGGGDGGGGGERCESVWATTGCSIYSWFFILNAYPLAVTMFSLLVTRAAVSRPEVSAPARNYSHGRLCVALAGLCWVGYRLAVTWMFVPQDYYVASTATVGGAVLLLAGGAALSCRCGCARAWRRLRAAYARGSPRFRQVDRRRRCLLFRSGLLLFVVRAVLEGLFLHEVSYEQRGGVIGPARDALVACYAAFDSVVDAWLVFGMGLAEIHSQSLSNDNNCAPGGPVDDPGRRPPASPRLRPMLVGWILFEAYLALQHWAVFGPLSVLGHGWYWRAYPALGLAGDVLRLAGSLAVGTLLWGWTREVRAVAYWIAANRLMSVVSWCLVMLVPAAVGRVVT